MAFTLHIKSHWRFIVYDYLIRTKSVSTDPSRLKRRSEPAIAILFQGSLALKRTVIDRMIFRHALRFRFCPVPLCLAIFHFNSFHDFLGRFCQSYTSCPSLSHSSCPRTQSTMTTSYYSILFCTSLRIFDNFCITHVSQNV